MGCAEVRGLRVRLFGLSVGERVMPRDGHAAACHAGEARARAASASRIATRRQSAAAGQADRRHGDLDAPVADANQRSDLEQLETDRAAGGLREIAVMRVDPA